MEAVHALHLSCVLHHFLESLASVQSRYLETLCCPQSSAVALGREGINLRRVRIHVSRFLSGKQCGAWKSLKAWVITHKKLGLQKTAGLGPSIPASDVDLLLHIQKDKCWDR